MFYTDNTTQIHVVYEGILPGMLCSVLLFVTLFWEFSPLSAVVVL